MRASEKPTVEDLKEQQEEHLRQEHNMAAQKKWLFKLGEGVCDYASRVGNILHTANPTTIALASLTTGILFTPAAGMAIAGCGFAAKHSAVGEGIETLQNKADGFKQARERETQHIRKVIEYTAQVTALPNEESAPPPVAPRKLKFNPQAVTEETLAEIEVIEDYVTAPPPQTPSSPVTYKVETKETPLPIVKVLSDYSKGIKKSNSTTNKPGQPPVIFVNPSKETANALPSPIPAAANTAPQKEPVEEKFNGTLANPEIPVLSMALEVTVSPPEKGSELPIPQQPTIPQVNVVPAKDKPVMEQTVSAAILASSSEDANSPLKDSVSIEERDVIPPSSPINDIVVNGASASHVNAVKSSGKKHRKKLG